MRVCVLAAAVLAACSGNIAPGEGANSTDFPGAAPSTGSETSVGPSWFDNPDFKSGGEMPAGCNGDLDFELRPVLRRTEGEVRSILQDVLGSRFVNIPLTEDGRVAGYRGQPDIVTDLEAARYSEFAREVAQSAQLACSADCLAVSLSIISELFGRPLEQSEQDRFRSGFDRIKADLGVSDNAAARMVLEAALQSPGFLYGLEPSASEPNHIRGADLAKRLAEFLWLSVPDAELLRAAAAGELETDIGYEKQVHRMLKDAKADRMLLDFHAQWLWLDQVRGESHPSSDAFPDVDDGVIRAMETEFERFIIDSVRTEADSLDAIFAGRVSQPGAELGVIYKQDLDGSTRTMEQTRAGVLSLPYVLTTHAHPEESSTVWRGQLIRTQLLCSAIPAPPANAALLAPDATGLSKRDAFEALIAVEGGACASCHQMMDPLGFALEHFDATGAYRTTDERGFEVDATGSAAGVPDDDALAQGFYGARELGEALAASSVAERCYVEQWLRYAWSASPSGDNVCHAQAVYKSFVDGGRSVEDLIVATAMSPAFRLHNPKTEELVCQ